MTSVHRFGVLAAIGLVLAGSASIIAAQSPGAASPVFTQTQADAGAKAYAASCAACHGANLEGGAAPALTGANFRASWATGSHTVAELHEVISKTMPLGAPGSLPEPTYLAITSFVLSRNGYAPGPRPLAAGVMNVKIAAAAPPRAPGSGADAGPPRDIDGFVFAPPPPKAKIARTANQSYPIAPLTVAPASGTLPTDAEIAKPAAADWLTFNRSATGDRYSPLDQITTRNAAALAPVCAFQLGEPGSFQNSPIVYKGVMYVASNHRVFAIDAATCEVKWGYTYVATDKEGMGSARGLALYDGKVFKGTADAHMIALDAASGKLLWEAVVDDSALGYCISAAPAAFAGRVYVGECGGDSGIRGHIHALDARTGKPVWTFNTVPQKGEPGYDSWSGGTDQGGGPSWSTITVDPAKNLVLAPIGNPGPDFAGKDRAGANLYTNSVVALDAATGKLAWYVQQVPHDTHDWDTAAAPAIWDRGGRRYIAVASKDGHLHVYDRDTRAELYAAKTMSKYSNADVPLSTDHPVTYCPGSHGQFNGPAYSPLTDMLFVGSDERCDTIQLIQPHYLAGRPYYGGKILTNQDDKGVGYIKGFDAATGRTVWTYDAARPVNAGVTATAGGLLLSGETTGRFIVLDQRTGKLLYSFMTGGAIAGGVSSYAVGARQYLAVASGNMSRDVSGTTGAPTIFVFGLSAVER